MKLNNPLCSNKLCEIKFIYVNRCCVLTVGNKFISSTSVFQFHACLRQFYTMTSGGEDPLVDAEETDKGMLDEKIAVNFASKDQLMSVPGIGEKNASAILSVRESSGNTTKPVFNLLTKNTLPAESWSRLDFQLNITGPRYDN